MSLHEVSGAYKASGDNLSRRSKSIYVHFESIFFPWERTNSKDRTGLAKANGGENIKIQHKEKNEGVWIKSYTTTQPEQHPPWPSSWGAPLPYCPGRPLPEVGIAGLPVCCSWIILSQNVVLCERILQLTLLYFLISRTRLLNASSTLMRCLADVSMNLQPKCLARSRPSENKGQSFVKILLQMLWVRTIHAYLPLIL